MDLKTHKWIWLAIVLPVFLIGCGNRHIDYKKIYSLEEKYNITDQVEEDDYKMIFIQPKDFELEKLKKGESFSLQIDVLLGSDMNKQIELNAPYYINFDLMQDYNKASFDWCKIKYLDLDTADYASVVYIMKCSDSKSTIFFGINSPNEELANDVLKEVYSTVTS